MMRTYYYESFVRNSGAKGGFSDAAATRGISGFALGVLLLYLMCLMAGPGRSDPVIIIYKST